MADPFWTNVELLLHFDGSDGSTAIADSSSYGHTINVYSGAELDTAEKKYGTASLRLPDYSGFIDATVSRALGTSDWTIEGYVWLHSSVNGHLFFDTDATNYDERTEIIITNSRTLWFFYYNHAGSTQDGGYGSTEIPVDTWTHVAVTKEGSTVRGFVGGNLEFTKTATGFDDPTTKFAIWGWPNTGDNTWQADEYRVTIGEALYTSSFTPPTGAFPEGYGAIAAAPSTQANQSAALALGSRSLAAATADQANAAAAAAITQAVIYHLPITLENRYRIDIGIPIVIKVKVGVSEPTLPFTLGTYPVAPTLPITFRVYAAVTGPTLPVVIYGNQAASLGDYATWKPKCVLDGTDISAKLIGGIDVEFDEQAAPVARFSLIPAAGAVDPLAWVGTPVRLYSRTLVGGVVTQEHLAFTGIVSDPTWSVDDRVLTLSCTGDMQSKYDAMTKTQIATQLAAASPTFSEVVFGDADSLSGWDYAEAMISTTPYFLWQDCAGVLRVDSILPAVSAHYTIADDGRFIGSDIEWPSRMDVLNQVDLQIDYRFVRKRSRKIDISFRPAQLDTPSLWLSCEGGWDLPQRDQIASAAESGGWYLTDDVTYVDVWPDGLYCTLGCSGALFSAGVSITDEVRATLCVGANWSAARRWVQRITETATITVKASESQAVVGVLADNESYGYESQYDDEDWERSLEDEGYSTSGMTLMSPGDYKLDLDTDRATFTTAQTVAINKARNDILRSHRGTTFTFQTVYRPEIDLSRTLHVDCAWVECQGKVSRVTHHWDIDTGDATSEISLALFRHNGAGVITDTPVAATDKADDPTETAFDRSVQLPMYIGGRVDVADYDEDWTGYVVNMPIYESASTDPVDRAEAWARNPANPAMAGKTYPEGMHVKYPDIAADYVDPVNAAAAAIFDVAVPEDLLLLTSG